MPNQVQNPKLKPGADVRAFTLVEMMVVVLVLTIFLGFGLTSGTAIKNQLAFFRDQQVVITQIYRARALAVATKSKEAGVCGYGISFSGNQINGFAVARPSFAPQDKENCELYYGPYGSNHSLQTTSCPSDVCSALSATLASATASGGSIAFVPPSPLVKFGSGGSSADITIRVNDVCGVVHVNQFGQVTTRGCSN